MYLESDSIELCDARIKLMKVTRIDDVEPVENYVDFPNVTGDMFQKTNVRRVDLLSIFK